MRGGRLDAPPKCLHLRLSWYWSFVRSCLYALQHAITCRVLADAQKIKIDDV